MKQHVMSMIETVWGHIRHFVADAVSQVELLHAWLAGFMGRALSRFVASETVAVAADPLAAIILIVVVAVLAQQLFAGGSAERSNSAPRRPRVRPRRTPVPAGIHASVLPPPVSSKAAKELEDLGLSYIGPGEFSGVLRTPTIGNFTCRLLWTPSRGAWSMALPDAGRLASDRYRACWSPGRGGDLNHHPTVEAAADDPAAVYRGFLVWVNERLIEFGEPGLDAFAQGRPRQSLTALLKQIVQHLPLKLEQAWK